MATATEPKPKTELVAPQSPFSAPIKFEVSMEQIDQLKREYMPLAIIDVNDKAQVERVHTARMDVTRLISGIEKGGKAMRDEANKFAKNVIAAERTFTDPLLKIRDHLANEEAKVKREAERIAKEAAEARQAVVRERLTQLKDCGAVYMAEDISDLPADEFDALLAAHQAEKKTRDEQAAAQAAETARVSAEQAAEKERLAKVAADLEAKRVADEARGKRAMARMELLSRTGFAHDYPGDQLADMPTDQWEQLIEIARTKKQERDKAAADAQAALDKQRQEQADAKAKIDAKERQLRLNTRSAELESLMPLEYDPTIGKRIADAKIAVSGGDLASLTDAEFEAVTNKVSAIVKARADEIEKTKADAIAEQERVAAETKAKAESEAAELNRQEELRPDREKIAIFADSIQNMAPPKLSLKAEAVALEIAQALLACSKAIRAAGSRLK